MLESSNVVFRYAMSSHTIRMTNTLKRGVVRVAWPIFNLWAPNDIYGTAEARIIKFYTQVDCIKS